MASEIKSPSPQSLSAIKMLVVAYGLRAGGTITIELLQDDRLKVKTTNMEVSRM